MTSSVQPCSSEPSLCLWAEQFLAQAYHLKWKRTVSWNTLIQVDLSWIKYESMLCLQLQQSHRLYKQMMTCKFGPKVNSMMACKVLRCLSMCHSHISEHFMCRPGLVRHKHTHLALDTCNWKYLWPASLHAGYMPPLATHLFIYWLQMKI